MPSTAKSIRTGAASIGFAECRVQAASRKLCGCRYCSTKLRNRITSQQCDERISRGGRKSARSTVCDRTSRRRENAARINQLAKPPGHLISLLTAAQSGCSSSGIDPSLLPIIMPISVSPQVYFFCISSLMRADFSGRASMRY